MTSQYHYGIYSQNRAAERHILQLLRSNWLTAELWPEIRQHCLAGLQR